MKYYDELLNLGCFSLNDIKELTGNINTAKNLLKKYVKRGLVDRVKHNYYVTIDIVDNAPVHSKYVIATKLDDANYVAYHTALEYYGLNNQVMNEVIYCGKRRFNDFDYDYVTYHFVSSKCDLQITAQYDGTRITTLERTVIDCIDDLDLAGGIEEVYRALDSISSLNEDLLIQVLENYDKKVLYQRVGYILSNFQAKLKLSDSFINHLHSKIDDNVCYLVSSKKKGKTTFDSYWNVCVPTYITQILTKGGDMIEL